MKFILLFMLIILMVSAVQAQLPENPYIGLFIDQDRSSSCVNGTSPYFFEMWIWCLPNSDGQMCAEFAIQYPSNTVESTITKNDQLISVELGSLPDGISVCYNECQRDWNWPYHQTIYAFGSDPSWIEIIPHPDIGLVQFADCTPCGPGCIELAIVYSKLGINRDCPPDNPVGIQQTTWGSIKNLLR